MSPASTQRLGAARGLDRLTAYRVPRPSVPCDLFLDGNEGVAPDAALFDALGRNTELLRRYPKPAALEAKLAERAGVDPARVVVTCGADEALLRCSLALLEPGRDAIVPVPTFEMLTRYVALSGGALREIPWPGGDYPTEEVIASIGERTGMIAVVSPNNPTGAIATPDDLDALVEAAPDVPILLDQAYGELDGDDAIALSPPASSADERGRILRVRTLSKAWGLAGLRVGYVIAPADIASWIRSAGGPYPVSGPALALALCRLESGEGDVARYRRRIEFERARLVELLGALEFETQPSRANFVFTRSPRARALFDLLAQRGIAVRAFEAPGLEDALRITCPGGEESFDRLASALEAARTELPEEVLP